jgi:selenocysteine lyase/cysteine desulfurase
MSASVRHLFDPDPDTIYLDAGTYGLPPRPAYEATIAAVARWRTGQAEYTREWEPAGERARALFAELIGAAVAEIALIPTVSDGVATIAASMPAGAEILVPHDEFASVVLPFLALAERRNFTVREAPYAEIAAAIRPSTTLVALSLTRAQSGETADLGTVLAAATANGARVLIDATHAAPFVPLAPHLASIDYLVCHGYKHLLLPRGVAFLYIRRDRQDDIVPIHANWRSGRRSYGGPIPETNDASKFDVSLAWHAWVGAVPALELLVAWNKDGTLAAAKELANRLARGLELPEPGASLVCVKVDTPDRIAAEFDAAGLRGAPRGSYLRLTPHVYNTEDEIDRAIVIVNNILSTN